MMKMWKLSQTYVTVGRDRLCINDFNYVCAIVHTFAKMCGAFDVTLYFVNPTF